MAEEGEEVPPEPLGLALPFAFGSTRTHIIVTNPELYRPELDLSNEPTKGGGKSLQASARDVMAEVYRRTRAMSSVTAGPAARLYAGPPSTHPFADDEALADDAVQERLFVNVVRPTILRHHEHRPIVLDVGVYEVRRQTGFHGERRGWSLVGD